MDSFMGEVRILPYAFAPRDWALCNGALMQISQMAALYSILGNVFGHPNDQTYNLPNIPAGGTVIGSGIGPGLTPRVFSAVPVGAATVAVTMANMGYHTHQMAAYALQTGSQVYTGVPSNQTRIALGANTGNKSVFAYNHTNTPDTYLYPNSMGAAGAPQPQPHPNEQPYLPMGYYISLAGEYPTPPN